jgi:hypothetical protein
MPGVNERRLIVQLAIVIEQPLCSGGLKEPLLCQLRYVDGKMSASHWQDHVSQYMNCSPIVLPRLCESQTHHEKLKVGSPSDSTSNGLNTPFLLKQLVERALLRHMMPRNEQGRPKGLHPAPASPRTCTRSIAVSYHVMGRKLQEEPRVGVRRSYLLPFMNTNMLTIPPALNSGD